MVNDPWSPMTQVEVNKKHYNACDIKSYDRSRRFYNITVQPVKWILHPVYNNILQNLPIMWEYAGMDEDIYGPSVPYLQGKHSATWSIM